MDRQVAAVDSTSMAHRVDSTSMARRDQTASPCQHCSLDKSAVSGNAPPLHPCWDEDSPCSWKVWLKFHARAVGCDTAALNKIEVEPCCCGRALPSCSSPDHIEAWDRLAETFEEQYNGPKAMYCALRCIHMDPSSPMGYCRVAKMIRPRQRQPASDATIRFVKLFGVRDAHHLWPLLKAVIRRGVVKVQNAEKKSAHHLVLYAMAHKLNLPVARQDPSRFPAEILTMILSYLTMADMIRCLRVSRSWHGFVLGNSQLWRHVILNKPIRNPSIKTFLNFLSQRKNSIRHLAINDPNTVMKLEAAKIDAIAKLPNLVGFSLRCLDNGNCFDFSLPKNPRPDGSWHLKELCILAIGDRARDLALGILRLTRPTLEALTFDNCDLWGKLGRLPSLKRLEANFMLAVSRVDSLITTGRNNLTVERVCLGTPKLEQLKIKGFVCLRWSNAPDRQEAPEGYWPHLHSLTIEQCVTYSPCCLPPLGPGMEVLELTTAQGNLAQLVLRVGGDSAGQASTQGARVLASGFPRLRVFRAARPIEPWVLERLLAPAIKSGALRELHLSLGYCVSHSVNSMEPARDLAFTFSDRVHTLGLYDFYWADRRRDGSNSDRRVYGPDSKPLADFVDQFPALRTVHLYPAMIRGSALFARDVMSRLKSKTLVTNASDGTTGFFEMKKLADQHGVRLIHQLRAGWQC